MALNSKTILQMPLREFRAKLKAAAPLAFTTLTRYRRSLMHELKAAEEEKDLERGKLADTKLRIIEKRMRDSDDKQTRRKAGTGKKVTVKATYKDTPSNRKLGRVGQEYERVVYEDAEVEECVRKVRRRKRPAFLRGEEDKPKRGNRWIRAVEQAKQELGAPGFVILRREPKDRDDPDQVMGARVYARAVEVMQEMKTAEAPASA